MAQNPPSSQKPKSRLGRGLSSLMSLSNPPAAPAEETSGEITRPTPESAPANTANVIAPPGIPVEIPIGEIQPNPHQPRKVIDDATIRELAASLKSNGIIQPIIVRKADKGYELIAGERRWRAAKLAGLATVPAIVKDVDHLTQAQMALVENIQREDLNPIDRAQGYRTLMDQLGLTQAELAGRLGEERSGIANYLRLLDLSDSVAALVRDGKLSLGHAKLLAGVADGAEQHRLAQLVIGQGLSVRNLERLLAEEPAVKPTRVSGAQAHLNDLEKSIARQLGMRVQVKSGTKGKGKVTIHYASLDQFDELMGRMGVKTGE